MNLKDIPFAKTIGLTESNGEYLFELADDVGYTNHLGSVAAAAQFSLAEFTSGQWLLNSFSEIALNVVPMLRKSQVKFKKPAHGRIRAKANVDLFAQEVFLQELNQHKRALITIHVDIVNDNNEKVMTGIYEWFIQQKTK
ncbi:MAG: YiiD C-terminal domain-containing protein [Bacteroidia bacterium]|nr:YiiD C-terminal domain-containing protein [Bacteroidia bacterium]